ncbi:hypothetical protein D9615_002404 [Tricholomella constricta]|uniref:Uncharacterized protein n=1 Tax=Tricholomella constricta TaxID=117010 RepID=A0A8H5HMG8_9AGAR|nr:hypothetical protein D9615_002404 [Tricholomella constricta]
MSSRDLDGPELSTSRIKRLLRPLRSRCSSLASFANSRTHQTFKLTSYASRRGGSSEENLEPPPLHILHPPGSLGLHKDVDKNQVEMARRVYAVRDCFRDIVVNTARRTGETTQGNQLPPRVISLAAICSIVVGDNMECNLSLDDSKEDSDEELANLVDSLYDSIPLEYRRWAVLSHALSLILNSTVHHPTLLIALLELTLDHKMFYESQTLLRYVLSLALGTASSKFPPICHPAHATFLFDLFKRWTAGGLSELVFFQICLQVLETVQSHDAWTCKAVHNLAQIMYGRNFASFLGLIRAFSDFGFNSALRIGHREPAADNATYQKAINSRFHMWLKMSFEQCPTNPTMAASESAEHSHAMGEMLLAAFATSPVVPDSLTADIRGLLLCLATCWLASQTHSSVKARLVDHLREALPQASTFTPLVTKVFSRSDERLDTLRETIEDLASTLRSCGLLQLEASLWACALRHIELPAHESQLTNRNGITRIQSYRHELIGLVDDAEHRCLGLRVLDLPHAVSLQKTGHPPFSLSSEYNLDGAWEWEALVGCWIRRREDPMSDRKKRKLAHVQHHTAHARRIHPSPFSMGPKTPKSSVSFARLRVGTDSGPIHLENVKDTYNDSEIGCPLRSTSHNFSSLLSDAFTKRETLHPFQRMCIRFRSETPPRAVHYPEYQGQQVNDDDYQHTMPFSDDSLNLFACASSSPIRP